MSSSCSVTIHDWLKTKSERGVTGKSARFSKTCNPFYHGDFLSNSDTTLNRFLQREFITSYELYGNLTENKKFIQHTKNYYKCLTDAKYLIPNDSIPITQSSEIASIQLNKKKFRNNFTLGANKSDVLYCSTNSGLKKWTICPFTLSRLTEHEKYYYYNLQRILSTREDMSEKKCGSNDKKKSGDNRAPCCSKPVEIKITTVPSDTASPPPADDEFKRVKGIGKISFKPEYHKEQPKKRITDEDIVFGSDVAPRKPWRDEHVDWLGDLEHQSTLLELHALAEDEDDAMDPCCCPFQTWTMWTDNPRFRKIPDESTDD